MRPNFLTVNTPLPAMLKSLDMVMCCCIATPNTVEVPLKRDPGKMHRQLLIQSIGMAATLGNIVAFRVTVDSSLIPALVVAASRLLPDSGGSLRQTIGRARLHESNATNSDGRR